MTPDGDRFHLFFLRASRALAHPDLRHLRAGIGHAVSTDLRSWTLLPDALVHADGPAWDDTALWTGSTVRGPDGRWYLFYTGVTRAGQLPAQRIGLAVSTDLITWHRHEPPVVEADPRWYACIGEAPGASETWRDPFVVADPDGGGWHMLVTARARDRPADGGVLGHAVSADLIDWEVRPPLSTPAGFHHLEVPQVVAIDGQSVLIFSCQPECTTVQRRTGGPLAAIWTVTGGDLVDGWDVAAAVPFPHPSLYAARLVQDRDGGWCLLGFRDHEHGAFHGEILDPVRVKWAGHRLLELAPQHP